MPTPPPARDPLTPVEERFMRSLTRLLAVLPRKLDADLVRSTGISATDYFVLVHVSEAPEQRMRMSDLAAGAAMSMSGISRVIDRLQKAGLVRRDRSPDDGRGWDAVLTDLGLQELREAWVVHLASARTHIFDHVGELDLDAVADMFQRMADS
ncbi:MarR family winged helix-turn-helix transcriptional regulator [Nocardioides sp. OK12]|uniref:MarR family winged helix-turn-helix transcriptional regulator n=1 Tax=Nocardioides sp. OK12 TaxID=2758661 RepID=UPI0021C47B15|nr:MarR family transcriptional regulator [Nocardioides sp. OK12]